MINVCKICGAEFDAAQRNHTICSDACRKINQKQYAQEYACANYEQKRRRERKHYYKNHNVKCRLCGKPTPAERSGYRKRYHEECIVKDAIDAILNGQKLHANQLNRLYARGYTVTEIREMARSGGNNG